VAYSGRVAPVSGTRGANGMAGIDLRMLPESPAVARVRHSDGAIGLALWRSGCLLDLNVANDPRVASLDRLLSEPLATIRSLLDDDALLALPSLDPDQLAWAGLAESQEVWGAGVTYLRSRDARAEEAVKPDIYEHVYEADRPELFFKAAGWRLVPADGLIGMRSDSTWDVPEPELSVLANSRCEVVAYAPGNDMSSRSIEGENPLYLPQAKVYDASCSIGPAAVLAWNVSLTGRTVRLGIERGGTQVFAGRSSLDDMVRDPADLIRVLGAVYSLPAGVWLLTGTSIVPPSEYTARPDDVIRISVAGFGQLKNTVRIVPHGEVAAPSRARSGQR
jgi:2-dehydro-3-deoxy-D-arabinonate dehydratase